MYNSGKEPPLGSRSRHGGMNFKARHAHGVVQRLKGEWELGAQSGYCRELRWRPNPDDRLEEPPFVSAVCPDTDISSGTNQA